ncbi:MAG TPA: hypothetical protein VKB70_02055, partial [Gaiellaceae bacterium]|nr:hypothetical protein [Gaiellaceae bacterium]
TQYHGKGEGTAWTLLILVILYAIAHALRIRNRPLAAGIFAFAAVIVWIVLVAVAFDWWGWTNGSFGNFHRWSWARLAFELLILAAAWDDRRRFRFPFIRVVSAVGGWVFLVDVLTSGGGNWFLALTLIVGLVYLVAGSAGGRPSGFWLHVVGGLLIGIPILVWCHTSDFDFAVISFMSLVFVAFGYRTGRSIWAVYGTIGFFIATVHFLVGSPTGIAAAALTGQPPDITAWSFPLAFGLLGFWLVGLGILGRRRSAPLSTPPVGP